METLPLLSHLTLGQLAGLTRNQLLASTIVRSLGSPRKRSSDRTWICRLRNLRIGGKGRPDVGYAIATGAERLFAEYQCACAQAEIASSACQR